MGVGYLWDKCANVASLLVSVKLDQLAGMGYVRELRRPRIQAGAPGRQKFCASTPGICKYVCVHEHREYCVCLY